MALEQQLLGPVTDLQSRDQDEITCLPGLHEAFPPEATRKRLSYLLALNLVGLQADPLFEVLEKGVLCPMIHLDILVLIGGVAEPLVRHFSGDWRWLPLVTTADDLDATTLEPVKEDLQRGAGYREFLVPDNHPGNELLPNPFGRPFCLATQAEVVIGLSLDFPAPHFFRQSMGRSEEKRIPLAEELDRSRGLAGAPAAIEV